jgi:hypothetical protein
MIRIALSFLLDRRISDSSAHQMGEKVLSLPFAQFMERAHAEQELFGLQLGASQLYHAVGYRHRLSSAVNCIMKIECMK